MVAMTSCKNALYIESTGVMGGGGGGGESDAGLDFKLLITYF